jgi:hypothetical protein
MRAVVLHVLVAVVMLANAGCWALAVAVLVSPLGAAGIPLVLLATATGSLVGLMALWPERGWWG